MMAAALCFLEPKKARPPYELALYWQCQRFPGAMPNAGGILDQPHALMRRMAKAGDIYEIFKWRDRANNKVEWADNNPEAYERYSEVKLWLMDDGYR